MALSDNLKRSGTRTDKVHDAYLNMLGDDQKALSGALSDTSYSHADISRALVAEGYEISPSQVREFRVKLTNGKVVL